MLLIAYPDRFIVQEALSLAEAAGYEVVNLVTQRYLSHAKYGVGSGKAQEVKNVVKELGLEAIVFDKRLRSVQIYNLAKLTGVEVIDREKLILEIFARRATTAEAKLQVKLAELRYEMPRAREKVRLAKLGEQPGFYGLGGYEVDVYYRDIKRRVSILNEKLKRISKRRALYRAQRQRLNIPFISLAGYTGAGKTTLFNQLTGEEKEVGKGAFTTLTTSTRAMRLSGFKVLISDTVGFISRLPTYMIEAFKSTLEELTYANLVLLLIDASEPLLSFVRKYKSCVSILAELQVSPSKVLLVFNKSDLIDEEELKRRMKAIGAMEERSAVVSAKFGWGIEKLKSILQESIFEYSVSKLILDEEEVRNLSDELEWLRKNAEVSIAHNDDGTVTTLIKGPAWMIDRFKAQLKS